VSRNESETADTIGVVYFFLISSAGSHGGTTSVTGDIERERWGNGWHLFSWLSGKPDSVDLGWRLMIVTQRWEVMAWSLFFEVSATTLGRKK
jgi:hypothetical protein